MAFDNNSMEGARARVNFCPGVRAPVQCAAQSKERNLHRAGVWVRHMVNLQAEDHIILDVVDSELTTPRGEKLFLQPKRLWRG